MAERIDLLPPDAEDDLRLRLALQSLAGSARSGEPAPAPVLRGIGTRRRRVRVAFTSTVAVAAAVVVVAVGGQALLATGRPSSPAAQSGTGTAPGPTSTLTSFATPSVSASNVNRSDDPALLPASALPLAGSLTGWRERPPSAANDLQQCLPTDALTLRWYAADGASPRAETAVNTVREYGTRRAAVDAYDDAVARQRLCLGKVAATAVIDAGDVAALTEGTTADAGSAAQSWVTVLHGRSVATIGFSGNGTGTLPNAARIPDVARAAVGRMPGQAGGTADDVVLSGLRDGPLDVAYRQQFGSSVDTGYLVGYSAGPDGLRLEFDRTLHLDDRQYQGWAARNGAVESDRDLGDDRWEVNRSEVTRTFTLALDARIFLGGRDEPVSEAELEQRLAGAGGKLRMPVLLQHTGGGAEGDVVLFQEEVR